jgi:thioredoxin reductase (NADPH)
MSDSFDVLVIGEGVAGLTAAGLLAKHGARIASFEANMFGGLVMNITHLDPMPADAPASGAEYATNLLASNFETGVTRFEERVKSLTVSESGFVASIDSERVEAPRVVVASGARWKLLGVRGESEFEGRGVSHCADCDGRLFSGRDVVVAGGGDSALQEALVLSAHCKKVHVLVRGPAFRAQQRFVDAVRDRPNIETVFSTKVISIEGERDVGAVTVRNVTTNETRSISCAGFFPFIGLVANTDYLPSTVLLDGEGRVVTNDRCATNLPGLWAIGAVRAGGDGLLAGAVSDAQMVAQAIVADRERQISRANA